MELGLKPWDTAEFLRDETDLAMYLAVSLEEEELPTMHIATLRVVARARGGVALLALESGIAEQELEAALHGSEEEALPVLRKLASAYNALSSGRKVA